MKTATALALALSMVTACDGYGESGGAPDTAMEQACDGLSAGGTRRDAAMPILGIHHTPSLTQERYEEVVRRLTGGRNRLESLSDGGIEGLLVHVAGQGADGFWIVDVWKSQDAVDRFAQRIRPIAEKAGITEPLRTYPVHTFLC